MRWFLTLFLLAATTVALAWLYRTSILPRGKSIPKSAAASRKAPEVELARLRKYGGALASYAKSNHYNTHFCFLVDMSLPSGSKRFFVYDLMKDSFVTSGLVTHGYGGIGTGSIQYSNVPGSNSTSLGRYKIGTSYMGKFGLAYKLHGLDATNSNAFNRFVVLHAHECVPSAEVDPASICMSQGCPTVAPAFLQSLRPYLDHAEKPVLLWIFK